MSSYESGPAWGVVTRGCAALVDDKAPLEVVERVWRALGETNDGDPLGAALGALVDAFGVTELPSFAVAVLTGGGVRAIARGGFEARISADTDADEVVRAEGASFWAERHVADATALVLRTADAATTQRLPLVDGVVRAAAVVVGETASADVIPREMPGVDSVRVVPARAATAPGLLVGEEAEPGFGAERDVPDSGAATQDAVAPESAPSSSSPPKPNPAASTEIPVSMSAGIAEPPPTSNVEDGAGSDETRAPNESTFSITSEPVAPSTLPVEEGTTAYDDLIFGLTRAATVEDAAVRTTEESAVASPPRIEAMPVAGSASSTVAGESLGDHDGLTVSAEQLQALRSRSGEVPAVAVGASTPDVVLVASTGARAVLDRGAVVGVRPSAVRATGIVPHLIAVPSPSGEISRRHLEIRVEAAHILAVDLDSTNGTRLLRVGAEPVRLHPGAATLLVAGDRLDLGDGVELSFEGLR